MIFSKKKFFFNIFNFFSKGGTLWCRNRQKIFFPFFKNFKNKTQKWLSWDHSNINRNKVMNFGGCSSYPAETARLFSVIRATMTPLPRIGLRWGAIITGFAGKKVKFSNFSDFCLMLEDRQKFSMYNFYNFWKKTWDASILFSNSCAEIISLWRREGCCKSGW